MAENMQLQLKIQANVNQALEGLIKLDNEIKQLNNTANKASKNNKLFSEIENEAKNAASSLSNSFGPLAGIIQKSLTSPLGAVGVVLGALAVEFKFFYDQALAGEKILKIDKQFQALSNTFGVAGETLRTEFINSLGGLVDDSDAIASLNKAFIGLGDKVSQLPAVMETARKATAVFGGDVTNNFELINQAIATGNTRALRQLGIIVDSEKAYQKYADSIGVAKDELSEAGRQQAILNEVLTQSDAKFKNISASSDSLANASKRLSVTFNNIIEQLQVFISKNYSEFFIDIFNAIDSGLKKITGNFTATDRVKELNEEIIKTQQELNKLNFSKFELDNLSPLAKQFSNANGLILENNRKIESNKNRLAELNKELASLTKTQEAANKETEKSVDINNDVDRALVNRRNAARLAEEESFNNTLLAQEEKYNLESERKQFEHQNRLNAIYSQQDPTVLLEERYAKEQELLNQKHDLEIEDLRITQENELAKAKLIEGAAERRDAIIKATYKAEIEGAKLAQQQLLESTELNNKKIEDSYKLRYESAKKYVDLFASGLTSSFISIAEGTESVGRSLERFAGNFIRQIAEMTLRAVIFDSVMKSLGIGVAASGGGSSGGGSGRLNGPSVPTMDLAEGGFVSGPGTGTSDSIPARLSNGEFVMTAKAVKKYGSNFFDNLNSAARGGVPASYRDFGHFADGGLVPSASQAPQVVIENKGSDKQVTRTEFDPVSAVTTVFIDDAQKNGPISKAIQSTYGLKRGGFR